MGSLIQSLDEVRCPVFDLTVDRTGYFKQAQSLWLGVETISERLAMLVKTTGECVEYCLADYRAKNFTPHITLFRKAGSAAAEDLVEPFIWKVNKFVLVESRTFSKGVEYTVLHDWALRS